MLRISTAYLARGLRDTVTQYDDKDVGEGTALDQVKYSYDDWADLTGFEQDKDSTVGGASGADEYEVAYTLTKPGRPTGRSRCGGRRSCSSRARQRCRP